MTSAHPPTGGPGDPDDREAADVAAYLAAEEVANDYHPDALTSDETAG